MPGWPQNQALCQQYVAIYTCPSDTRANQLVAPETLAPDGGTNPQGGVTYLYMTGSYKAMSGVGRYDNTNTFSGYWDEAVDPVIGAKFNPDYTNGMGAFHADGGITGLNPSAL